MHLGGSNSGILMNQVDELTWIFSVNAFSNFASIS